MLDLPIPVHPRTPTPPNAWCLSYRVNEATTCVINRCNMKRSEGRTTPVTLPKDTPSTPPHSPEPSARWGRSNRPRKGLLDRVLDKWGVTRPEAPTEAALEALHAAYLANVPFENATKLIKVARAGTAGAAIRGPVEFWEEHLRWGSGGTCFSSAAAYQFLLRYAGFPS